MRAVNLIPADQREGAGGIAGRSGGAALIVLALIAGLALLAVLYGSAHRNESKSRAELATVNAEVASARAQAGRMAPYTSFIAMANQRVQAVSQLVASRFDWSHAFNELGRVLPHDAVLTSLHGQVGATTSASSGTAAAASATPASTTPPGSTPVFTISGCSTSQSEVAQTLQRLRLIDGVTEVTLQSSVKGAAKSGGSSSASEANGPCGSGAANFSAQITFAGLPGAPATGATGAAPGAAGAGAAGAGAQAGTQPVPVSNPAGAAK
jgi:Tfp pilus assembly protein PilN